MKVRILSILTAIALALGAIGTLSPARADAYGLAEARHCWSAYYNQAVANMWPYTSSGIPLGSYVPYSAGVVVTFFSYLGNADGSRLSDKVTCGFSGPNIVGYWDWGNANRWWGAEGASIWT